jgi:hypothetical protein
VNISSVTPPEQHCLDSIDRVQKVVQRALEIDDLLLSANAENPTVLTAAAAALRVDTDGGGDDRPCKEVG